MKVKVKENIYNVNIETVNTFMQQIFKLISKK